MTGTYAQSTNFLQNKLEVSAFAFYKQQDFRWSIAGNLEGQNPNVYSELIWNNLKGPGVGIAININPWKQLVFRTSYSQNSISSGTVTDTDYQQDNRESPSYQALLKSDKGNTSSLETGIGYKFFKNKKLHIIPYIGFTHDKQSLYLLKDETSSSEKQLNTTYQTVWAGPYIGLEVETQLFHYSKIKFNLNYYQVDYSAKADWNMIDAFAHPISFKHEAKGYQLKSQMLADNPINKTLSIFLKGSIFYSVTAAGTDYLYLLNEVIGKGTEIGLGLHLKF